MSLLHYAMLICWRRARAKTTGRALLWHCRDVALSRQVRGR